MVCQLREAIDFKGRIWSCLRSCQVVVLSEGGITQMSTNWRKWILQHLKSVPGTNGIYFRHVAQDLIIRLADGQVIEDRLDPLDMDAPGKVRIDTTSDDNMILFKGRYDMVVPWIDVVEVKTVRNDWG